MPFQLTEGTPVHDAGSYYHAGRGGAGNYRRLPSTTSLPATVATALPAATTPSNPRVFFGGRGGAGNIKPKSERAMFSFDEELERDRLFHEHHAPVYSIGRGGAGNIVPSEAIATRSHYSVSPAGSPDSTPRSSTSSPSSSPRFSSHSLRSGADRVWGSIARVRSSS
ncbi:unnamed protein product [Tuber melanosporum]|uniref:(Perigord truffle) hypothetical protein n=1 Tax=Tuber melanosporum (strain Mel28) TaxID=656061 RepID=D5GPJ4_TUBMM|nr:uncharacterized protein GSTUM_00011872001 [Tuber melanosporum]CAZ86437.1 unnamed protein product [Tuber melanosporum]